MVVRAVEVDVDSIVEDVRVVGEGVEVGEEGDVVGEVVCFGEAWIYQRR